MLASKVQLQTDLIWEREQPGILFQLLLDSKFSCTLTYRGGKEAKF